MPPQTARPQLPALAPELEVLRPLLTRLVQIFTDLGPRDAVERVFTPDAVIETHYERGEFPEQRHQGLDQIAAWIAMPRAECRFFVEEIGEERRDEEARALRVRYGYEYKQYTQRGWWTLELRGGRIHHMQHAPDSLANTPRGWWEQYGVPVPYGDPEEPLF